MYCGEECDSEVVTFAAVSVSLGGDAEAFERTNDVFVGDTLTCDFGVARFWSFVRGFFLDFLCGRTVLAWVCCAP